MSEFVTTYIPLEDFICMAQFPMRNNASSNLVVADEASIPHENPASFGCIQRMREAQLKRMMMKVRRGIIWLADWASSRVDHDQYAGKQIEDYRPGYPQFSALVGSHDAFHVYRRFSSTRARLLLLKQDRVSALEQQLEKIDYEETSPLFLGTARRDRNAARLQVLDDIDAALVEYDTLVARSHRILSLESAKRRDIGSLRNWIAGTACVAREETAYLSHPSDLINISSPKDHASDRLETLLEESLMRFWKGFRGNSRMRASRDPNVYIYAGFTLKRMGRFLMALIIVTLLLVPVVIINTLNSTTHRMIVIVAASMSFLVVLSGFTKARTNEMFIAGATYATVLVVFVVSTGFTSNYQELVGIHNDLHRDRLELLAALVDARAHLRH